MSPFWSYDKMNQEMHLHYEQTSEVMDMIIFSSAAMHMVPRHFTRPEYGLFFLFLEHIITLL